MTLVNSTLLNSSFISNVSFGKPHEKPEGPNNLLLRRIICPNTTTVNVSERKSANYQPTLWNYDFLQSLKRDYADIRYEDKAKKLLEEVRRMIKDENTDIWVKLELIDDVKRLGIGYRFDKEIGEALHRCLFSERSIGTITHHRSLHETALSFRLLREYGYDIRTDIFERFKDCNGNLKASLGSDVKGMLSLYCW